MQQSPTYRHLERVLESRDLTPLGIQLTPPPTPSPTPSVGAGIIPPSLSSPSPIPRPTTYIVKSGDTLDDIAKLFNLPTSYLAKTNKITNPNYIYIDQVLNIPPKYIPETQTGITMVPGKMILVVLSEQKTYAYENGVLLADFLISSGLPEYPTVQGDYLIQTKLELTRMTGDGYDLEDVPWVMYFFRGYSFHGTYWHSNFGTPMSHGCLNMYTPDAEWLYHWAPIGTLVRIIP